MNTSYAGIFGGLIAVILLLLYAGSILYVVFGLSSTSDVGVTIGTKMDGFKTVIGLVGGLVSALVTAELATANPKTGAPGAISRNVVADSQTTTSSTKTLILIYLFVWVLAGLSALIAGVMTTHDRTGILEPIGTTWLGVAITSVYAYFGITLPQGGTTSPTNTITTPLAQD